MTKAQKVRYDAWNAADEKMNNVIYDVVEAIDKVVAKEGGVRDPDGGSEPHIPHWEFPDGSSLTFAWYVKDPEEDYLGKEGKGS